MKFIAYLIDLLFPRRCAFCERVIPQDLFVCEHCTKALPYTGTFAVQHSIPYLRACMSPLFYEGTVRDSLLRYKFHGHEAHATAYADFIAKTIDENQLKCDIITWVPISRVRARKRGYNQAELIAQRLSELLGVDAIGTLEKKRNNAPQSGIQNREARQNNVCGVYSVKDGVDLTGLRVLIVDDVVTTGATISECAKMLSGHGASTLFGATVARHRDN